MTGSSPDTPEVGICPMSLAPSWPQQMERVCASSDKDVDVEESLTDLNDLLAWFAKRGGRIMVHQPPLGGTWTKRLHFSRSEKDSD